VPVINLSGTTNFIDILGQYPAKPNTLGLIDVPAGFDERVVLDDVNKTINIDGVRVKAMTVSPFGASNGTVGSNMTITNCVIDGQTAGGTQSGNITNAAYDAL
jgi:hypothetical protein